MDMIRAIWGWFLSLIEMLLSCCKDPMPVAEALPKAIEESEIIKILKTRYAYWENYEYFNTIKDAMVDQKTLVFTNVQTHRVVAGIAVWLVETVPNIRIALASPNLKHSEQVRDIIDMAMSGTKTKIKNKDRVVYANGAEIRTVTHNSYRGTETDVLLLNAPEYMQEYQIGQYVSSQTDGRIVGVILNSVRLKPSYFTGFSRWNAFQRTNELVPESLLD